MSTTKVLSLREISNGSFCHPINYGFILEDLRCIQTDRHIIESPELGEASIYPLSCSFSHVDRGTLAVADDSGGLLFLNTEKSGPEALITEWLAHKNAVFDIDWIPGKGHILTASGDQTIALWDVWTEESIVRAKAHTSSVKTVKSRNDDMHVFASGSRDGQIMVWDSRVKMKGGYIPPVNVIKHAHAKHISKKKGGLHSLQESSSNHGITAVLFQDSNTIISSGSADGSIKLWDLRKNYSHVKNEAVPKHVFSYSGLSQRSRGYSHLTLDAGGSKLFASCMDDTIYQYNCAGSFTKPVASYKGHKNGSFYVRSSLSPDSRYLLSGSSDGVAYIWPVDHPQASPIVLKGHTPESEVSCVAWCRNTSTKIVTAGDDSAIKVWRLDRNCTADSHEITGTAVKKHKNKGVSAMNALKIHGQNIYQPSKPRKGTFYASPAKISTAMKASISALGENSSQRKISIDLWVQNATHNSNQSPRKTPKKLVIQNCKRTTAKRKLCDAENLTPTPSNKRIKVDSDSSKDEIFLSGVKTFEPSCEMLNSCEKESVKKDLFSDISNTTPVKPSQTMSPTVNLPNYVLDPQPRTPVGAEPTTQRNTPNWLQQMSASKRKSAQEPPKVSETVTAKPAYRRKLSTKRKSTNRARGLFSGTESPTAELSNVRNAEEASTQPSKGVVPRGTPVSKKTKTRPETPDSSRKPSMSILKYLTPTNKNKINE